MTTLKKKLASYTALSSAFLASNAYNAESQVIYVDIPDDPIICNRAAQVNNITGSSNVSRGVWLNVLNGAVVTTNVSATAYAQGFALYNYASVYSYSRFFQTVPFNTFKYDFDREIDGSVIGKGSFARNLSNYILRFNEGAQINNITNFGTGKMGGFYFDQNVMTAKSYNGGTFGYADGSFASTPLPSSVTGFIGFRFDQGGGDQYGWIRVTVDLNGDISVPLEQNIFSESCITIHDYAYQETPGAIIRAGEGLREIPTLGQWGLIILNMLLLIFGITAFKQRILKERKASS